VALGRRSDVDVDVDVDIDIDIDIDIDAGLRRREKVDSSVPRAGALSAR